MTALLQRLGFAPEARVMLLSCTELGLCHAANVGVFEVLHGGIPASASLMVPAPWARESAAHYRGDDVGVHLTVNAEHNLYRWGPLTLSPSLLDGDGGFPRTVDDIWDHADLDEVRRECRAQIERAVLWGFDITHLDTHLNALLLRPEFFDVYLQLAVEFALPIRLADDDGEANAGFPFRSLADAEGVVFPDAHRALPPIAGPDELCARAESRSGWIRSESRSHCARTYLATRTDARPPRHLPETGNRSGGRRRSCVVPCHRVIPTVSRTLLSLS